VVAKAAIVTMTKRWLVNGALFLVALGLGLFLWDKPETAAPYRAPQLTTIKTAAISAIIVQRASHRTIVFKRIGSQWFVLRPLAARADRFRVEALTDLAHARTSDHFAAPMANLAAFGLAPPEAVLTLNHERILIGKRGPLGNLRYVLVGHTIALVPTETIGLRHWNTDSFLSTKLLGDRIHPVAFDLPHFTVIREHGIWRVMPKPTKVSNDQINTFVDEWRYARALAVTPYQNQPVIGRITIHYRTESHHAQSAPGAAHIHTLTIDIAATQPELVLVRRDQGLAYHFPKEIGQHLLHLDSDAGTP